MGPTNTLDPTLELFADIYRLLACSRLMALIGSRILLSAAAQTQQNADNPAVRTSARTREISHHDVIRAAEKTPGTGVTWSTDRHRALYSTADRQCCKRTNQMSRVLRVAIATKPQRLGQRCAVAEIFQTDEPT